MSTFSDHMALLRVYLVSQTVNQTKKDFSVSTFSDHMALLRVFQVSHRL